MIPKSCRLCGQDHAAKNSMIPKSCRPLGGNDAAKPILRALMTALVRRLLVVLVRILVGARSEWRGCAPDASRRIYFANHGSHFDTIAVMAALPWPVRRLTHPVAARDYWGKS